MSAATVRQDSLVLLAFPSLALAGPPPSECKSNDDCVGGMICADGWCSFESECQSDADCVEIHGFGSECMMAGCGGSMCSEADPKIECSKDTDCGECGICNEGYCAMDTFMKFQCESDADCGANARCSIEECSSQCVLIPAQDQCPDGQVWNECAQSSCPMCTDCIGACVPVNLSEQQKCEKNGGTWNDCPAVGDGLAVCGDPVCIPGELTPAKTCELTGGTWNECAHGSCPTCEDCVAACVYPVEKRAQMCEQSGGTWDECASSSCPSCPDCIQGCVCPVGTINSGDTCVPDEPVNTNMPQTDQGSARGTPTSGCSTSGNGTAPVVPVVLVMCALLALRRRTPRTALRSN